MNLIQLPVIPIPNQIQLLVGRSQFNSNSNSWIEWRPILKFRILHKPGCICFISPWDCKIQQTRILILALHHSLHSL